MLPPLLKTMIEALATLPQIDAILLDETTASSQYFFHIYTRKSISKQTRLSILGPFSHHLTLDDWIKKPEDRGINTDGFVYYLSYDTLADLDTRLDLLLKAKRFEPGFSTKEWRTLLYGCLLFDRERCASALREKYSIPYSSELQKAIIDHNWSRFNGPAAALDHIETACKQKDWIKLQHWTTIFFNLYFDILIAVNHQLHPGQSDLFTFVTQLPLKPNHMEKDLEQLWNQKILAEYLPSLHSLAHNLAILLVQNGWLTSLSYQKKDPHSTNHEILSPTIKAYTDGGCLGNPGQGAWAYIVIDENHEWEHSGNEILTTNNRMELTAIIEALSWINQHHQDKKRIEIFVDSQYACSGITQWIKQWEQNGWLTSTKEPVKNQDLWQKLQKLDQILRPEWKWVKGHSGNIWNERCDQLVRKVLSKTSKQKVH